MPRFLIEVQEPEAKALKRACESIRLAGSHFAAHAAWHRRAGFVVGRMVVEAGDRRSAAAVVPPYLRGRVHVRPLPTAAA